MKVTVILTCAGSQVTPSTVAMIEGHPYYALKVVGIDSGESTSMASALAVASGCIDLRFVPKGNSPHYLSAIKNVIRETGAKAILVSSDEEALNLSKHSEVLASRGCVVCCPDFEVVCLVLDKLALLEKAHFLGLGIWPSNSGYFSLGGWGDLEVGLGILGLPCVIKPRTGRGSRGFRVVTERPNEYSTFLSKRPVYTSKEELVRFFKKYPNQLKGFFLQKYYPGDKYCVDILAEKGEVRSMVIRNNGRDPKVDPPTQFAEIVFDSDVRELCTKLVEALRLDFCIEIEVARDSEGEPMLLEINPRLDATLHCTGALGLNFYQELIIYAIEGKYREDLPDYKSRPQMSQRTFVRFWDHSFVGGS